MGKIKQLIVSILKKLGEYLKTDMVYVAKGSFWSILSQTVLAASAFLMAIAFAHFVSKEAYGQYKYILSIAGVLKTFTLTGIGVAVIQSVSRGFEGTMHYAFWQNIKWSALFFLLSTGSAVYYFANGNSSLGISLLIIGCLWPFLASTNLYNAYLSAKRDFRRLSIYFDIIGNLFPYACIFATMLITSNPVWLVTAFIVSNTLIGVILYWRIVSIYKPNKQVDRKIMSYSKHLSLIGILSGLLENIDQILIFHYIGPAQLAIYNFATAIPNQIKGPIANLGNLIFPKFAISKDSDIRAGMKNKMMLLFIGGVIIIGAYIIAAPYIFHAFFPKYTDSIFYSQIFSISLLFIVSIPSDTYLTAKKKIKEQYIGSILGYIIKITLLFVGIYWWGLLGLVIARVITRFSGTIMSIILFNKASKNQLNT